MVEHSHHHSKVEGLSPAAASTRGEEGERERERQIINIRVLSFCQKKYHFRDLLFIFLMLTSGSVIFLKTILAF